MSALAKGWREGTHRLVSPEETLAKIRPHLGFVGVTRCARVTGLDRIGIPVYCAMRPTGLIVQVANGKGCSDIEAKVSALMEAVESFHIEYPGVPVVRAKLGELSGAVAPETITGFVSGVRYERVDWVDAVELASGRPTRVPASAVYAGEPQVVSPTTNGLASGNHVVEATLHALYELVERHAISAASRDGKLRFTSDVCDVVHTSSVQTPRLRSLLDRVEAAGAKIVLVGFRAVAPITTFLAILLDPSPFGSVSRLNMGSGAHLDAEIAAVRAVTEAAQSRLTFIHGAREDLTAHAWQKTHDRAYAFFDGLRPRAGFGGESSATGDLGQDLGVVIDALGRAGFGEAHRVDLTRDDLGIPVVKVVVPGLRFSPHLF